MQIIAKLAIAAAALGGLGIAGSGAAAAATVLPRPVGVTTIPADAPFDDLDDYVRGEIHQHIAGWPGWQHNWHPGDWRDDDWDDDWDDRWDD